MQGVVGRRIRTSHDNDDGQGDADRVVVVAHGGGDACTAEKEEDERTLVELLQELGECLLLRFHSELVGSRDLADGRDDAGRESRIEVGLQHRCSLADGTPSEASRGRCEARGVRKRVMRARMGTATATCC